jgi:hypothetical protein
MSFQGEEWIDPTDWFPAPDPNRDNYFMVKLQHRLTQQCRFYDIHANETGTKGQPGYVSANENAMTGAETLNPGWESLFAHHQRQSRGVFGTGGPRD